MKFFIYTLKSIVVYILICTLLNNNYKSQCDYTIDMQDSYGDGWNGASIDVEINGVNIANFTISSGSSGSGSFATYTDDVVDFIFNPGSWDSEITFQITDPSGEEIYSGGAPSDIEFLSHTSNSICDPPSCPIVENILISEISTSSAMISWTPGNSDSLWLLTYDTLNFDHQ